MSKDTKTSRPPTPPSSSNKGWGWELWNFSLRPGAEMGPRTATFMLAMLVVVWLVGGAYLLLVSETMVTARHIQALRDELAYWYKENAALEAEIARRTNVQELMRLARQEGFALPEEVVFVEP